jgi:hypothetical protein
METLPIALLIEGIFPFIGDGRFRFVAAVNRQFYTAYTSNYCSGIKSFNHVCTVEHANLAEMVLEERLPVG